MEPDHGGWVIQGRVRGRLSLSRHVYELTAATHGCGSSNECPCRDRPSDVVSRSVSSQCRSHVRQQDRMYYDKKSKFTTRLLVISVSAGVLVFPCFYTGGLFLGYLW